MTFFKTAATLTVTAALLSSMALAGSHGGDVPASVKARQAHMRLNIHNAGILFGMAQDKAPYDAERAAAAAGNLATLSKVSHIGYWEPGTDSESIEGTRALPAIFAADSEAGTIAGQLSDAADALAAVAGDGLDALKANIGPVGQACTACHEKYRAPSN